MHRSCRRPSGISLVIGRYSFLTLRRPCSLSSHSTRVTRTRLAFSGWSTRRWCCCLTSTGNGWQRWPMIRRRYCEFETRSTFSRAFLARGRLKTFSSPCGVAPRAPASGSPTCARPRTPGQRQLSLSISLRRLIDRRTPRSPVCPLSCAIDGIFAEAGTYRSRPRAGRFGVLVAEGLRHDARATGIDVRRRAGRVHGADSRSPSCALRARNVLRDRCCRRAADRSPASNPCGRS